MRREPNSMRRRVLRKKDKRFRIGRCEVSYQYSKRFIESRYAAPSRSAARERTYVRDQAAQGSQQSRCLYKTFTISRPT